MSATLTEIDIDWTDFEGAGQQSRQYLRDLTADKSRLREMVLAVQDDPKLLEICERHQLFDCIVLHDAESGSRLEVHVSTGQHVDHPHDHRFSFSSFIVCGGYDHTWYKPARPRDEQDGDGAALAHGAQLRSGGGELATQQAALVPYVTRFEQPGSCYSLHHSVIHATATADDTVSLFLRGPEEKDATTMQGRGDGTPERREKKPMSVDCYRDLCAKLESLEVI
jgi:hypothetical protein